eukprot:6704496-Pyramimonas_sp.AAC.2
MMKRNRITQQNNIGEALGSSRCCDTSKKTRRMFTMPVKKVASDLAVCASDEAVCGSADFEEADRHTDVATASTRQGASDNNCLVNSLQGDIVTSLVVASSARRISVALMKTPKRKKCVGSAWRRTPPSRGPASAHAIRIQFASRDG